MHPAVFLLSFLFSRIYSYSFEEILSLKCEHLPYRTQFKEMSCSISTSRTVDCSQFLIYDGKLKTKLEGEDGKICTISWENICGRDTITEELCRKVVTNKKNFWDAAEDCTNQGYTLFSPHSDYQLQSFWEIVRSNSEQEFWTGAGTYRNKWLFHDQTTVDFFRLNPDHDFNQDKNLALTFTSKSWFHSFLGYTRVVPAANLYAYVCVRKGLNPNIVLPEPENFPKDEEPTTTTTTTRRTTITTTTKRTTTTTTPTTTTTTTKKYCVPGGEWTDWDETPKQNGCDDFCGSAGRVVRTRRCLSMAWGCPCTGPTSYNTVCESTVCLYPRSSCLAGFKKVIVGTRFLCGPIPGNPPDTPKPPGYCPSHGLGIWSQWGDWGACSATCGLCGAQQRTRSCISPANCRCVGQGVETRSCPFGLCPGGACCRGYNVYTYDNTFFCREIPQTQCPGTWTDWTLDEGGTCTAPCGGCGYSQDKRWCYPSGCQCPGPWTRISQNRCPRNACPAPQQQCCAPFRLQYYSNRPGIADGNWCL